MCTSPRIHLKLKAIHGHATWQHHSPSPLKLKVWKCHCQIAQFAGEPCIFYLTSSVSFASLYINYRLFDFPNSDPIRIEKHKLNKYNIWALILKIRYSSVSVVTSIRAENYRVQMPIGARDIFFSTIPKTVSGFHPVSNSIIIRVLSQGVRGARAWIWTFTSTYSQD